MREHSAEEALRITGSWPHHLPVCTFTSEKGGAWSPWRVGFGKGLCQVSECCHHQPFYTKRPRQSVLPFPLADAHFSRMGKPKLLVFTSFLNLLLQNKGFVSYNSDGLPRIVSSSPLEAFAGCFCHRARKEPGQWQIGMLGVCQCSACETHASLLMQQEFITSEDNAVIWTSSFFILLMTCDESPCYTRCCSMRL